MEAVQRVQIYLALGTEGLPKFRAKFRNGLKSTSLNMLQRREADLGADCLVGLFVFHCVIG